MRRLQGNRSLAEIAPPAVVSIFVAKLFEGIASVPLAASDGSVVLNSNASLFWVALQPFLFPSLHCVRMLRLVRLYLTVVLFSVALVVTTPNISLPFRVAPVPLVFFAMSLLKVCVSLCFLLRENCFFIGAIFLRAARTPLVFMSFVVVLAILAKVFRVGAFVFLKSRKILFAMFCVVSSVTQLAARLALSTETIRLRAIERKQRSGFWAFTSPTVFLYDDISQGVNLREQVSFWSGSFGVSRIVRAVSILTL